eukprot:scaffold126301_cov31-Tisochrysis_lutea.AAC.3
MISDATTTYRGEKKGRVVRGKFIHLESKECAAVSGAHLRLRLACATASPRTYCTAHPKGSKSIAIFECVHALTECTIKQSRSSKRNQGHCSSPTSSHSRAGLQEVIRTELKTMGDKLQ